MVRKLSRNLNDAWNCSEIASKRRLATPATGLLVAYVLFFQFVGSVHAESVSLAWDPNADLDLAGYRVYRSEQSGVFATPPLNSSLLTATSFTDTTVQQGHTYYYVVTAVNTTGVESGYSNQVQAIVPAPLTNKTPTANAGADQTITLPATATLTAIASDDGLPNGTLTYQWSVVSGSGVTLTPTNTASTKATFTAAGTYTFRVTVSDGQLSASDDVVVIVNPAAITNNKAPIVNAGADQTVTLPGTANLTATASDDGLPTSSVLTYQWSVVSGSGVTLTPTNTASTKATFTAAGTYTLRVTVSDSQLAASDDVVVIVSAAATSTTNKAPTVNAGADQTITLPASATLTAVATDDGLPNKTLTYRWTIVSGMGANVMNATFATAQVSFAAAGTYTFRVTVSDGQLTASDDVTVVVNATSSDLIITISKNGGTTITAAITPVYVSSPSGQTQTLELLIDDQTLAKATGTSLTYRWKTNKVPVGNHILKANAYIGQALAATKTLTVTIR